MIRIITDSASDMKAPELSALGVDLITLATMFNGEAMDASAPDFDSAFWSRLISGENSTTSQPSPDAFTTIFEQAKAAGDSVICILISSALSGTYQCANIARDMVDYDDIHLVDSLSATVGEKLLVLRACALRDEGKLSAKEIADELNALRSKIRIFASLDTLDYLARGGRIPKAAASIGSLVKLKALITISAEGTVAVAGKALGRARSFESVLSLVRSHPIDTAYPVFPIYSYSSENVEAFLAKFTASDIACPVDVPQGIGPIIGTHIGPGAYGIVYIEK